MKTGILVTARLGSSRLKRKHLLEANGKPLIQHLLDRVKEGFREEIRQQRVVVVIATSDEPENRDLEQFSGEGVVVFYGPLSNIPLRHLLAARSHDVSKIVSVDGDDILCSVNGMRQIYDSLADGTPYVKTSGLPFGMNSFGYARDFLERSLEGHHGEILETGWGRVFNDAILKEIAVPFAEPVVPLRFTLDYAEDYDFFKAVIENIGSRIISLGDEELIDVVVRKRFYEINARLAQEYWANFYQNMESEAQHESK
jgi:spore coat polysaccharide biosynthesis protein SpsF (cytidylyltransferase family)